MRWSEVKERFWRDSVDATRRQTLPVIPLGSRSHIVGACLCRSPLWLHIKLLHLTKNMRLDQSPESVQFAKWLLCVGAGTTTQNSAVALPATMKLPENSIQCLINHLYPDIQSLNKPDQFFLE